MANLKFAFGDEWPWRGLGRGLVWNAGGFRAALTRHPFCKHLWRGYFANANVGFWRAIPFRGHRMDMGTLSFILCRGSARDAEEVISSQAGDSAYEIPFVCLG